MDIRSCVRSLKNINLVSELLRVFLIHDFVQDAFKIYFFYSFWYISRPVSEFSSIYKLKLILNQTLKSKRRVKFRKTNCEQTVCRNFVNIFAQKLQLKVINEKNKKTTRQMNEEMNNDYNACIVLILHFLKFFIFVFSGHSMTIAGNVTTL